MATEKNETPAEETPKAPKKPKFNGANVAAAIAEAGEFDTFDFPERNTKAGLKPARTALIATNRKQLLAKFGGDEKAMLFHCSNLADLLFEKWEAKNSPEKIAERTEKKAEKLLEKLDPKVLDALLARLAKK